MAWSRSSLSVALVCSLGLHGVILALSAAWAAIPQQVSVEDGLVFVSLHAPSPEAPSATVVSAGGIRPRPAARQREAGRTAVRSGGRDRARDPRPRAGNPGPAPALASGAVAAPPRAPALRPPAREQFQPAIVPEPVPPVPPPPESAERLTPEAAAARRIHDVFPSLPADLRARHALLAVELDVCVSRDGVAHAERIAPRVDREVHRLLTEAVASWRYQPLISAGGARPFCHALSLQYRNH